MKPKKKIVLTGGKFNKIHPGHVWLLRKVKKLGYLVVVIAHDSHNKKSYAVSAKVRKKNIEKLKIADKIVIGSPTKFSLVVKRFKPNVIILGYDQKFPDRESEALAKKMKIKIVRLRKHGNYKTRNA